MRPQRDDRPDITSIRSLPDNTPPYPNPEDVASRILEALSIYGQDTYVDYAEVGPCTVEITPAKLCMPAPGFRAERVLTIIKVCDIISEKLDEPLEIIVTSVLDVDGAVGAKGAHIGSIVVIHPSWGWKIEYEDPD